MGIQDKDMESVLFTEEELRQRVKEMGAQIAAEMLHGLDLPLQHIRDAGGGVVGLQSEGQDGLACLVVEEGHDQSSPFRLRTVPPRCSSPLMLMVRGT